ncbi:hypothetical protein [Paenibacillus aestuarii]|uniref:Uncharacterized protein n=1 Tax=Paenibacillus aestuarii TaxID=516965 RepID=A0ABW0KBA2_9BACL|nr:hypothetical protein [Paenibacillus aestuarii]
MNKKKAVITSFIVILIIIVAKYGIQSVEDIFADGNYKIYNVNIYKETPAWKLALAVRDQKTKTIEKILKSNPSLLNYQ